MAELRVVVAPDIPEIIERINPHLRSAGFNPTYRPTSNEVTCLEALREHADVIIAAHGDSTFGAGAVLKLLRHSSFSIPLIVIGERAGERIAAQYGRGGAETYLPYDELDQLGAAVREALKNHSNPATDNPDQSSHGSLEQRIADLEVANAAFRELDRRRSQYIYDVSHELRNPITNLSMGLFLLQRDRERRTKHLVNLKAEMDRLMNLMAHVLDLAQIDLNLEPRVLKPVDLNMLVEQVIEMHRSRAEPDGIQLIFEPSSDLPVISADEQQLQQAFANILVNAINFTNAGEIRVITAYLADQDTVSLQIKDTGIGIPPAELPRVFERFFHGRIVGRSAVRGTGLGLSIVHEIIQAHQGKIELESEVGQGTTVRILLPVSPVT